MQSEITAHATISINTSSSKVWRALTDSDLIKQYFLGTNADSNWKEGSPVAFSGEYKGKAYESKGKVLRNIPEKLLQYTYWSSMSGIEDKPENYVIVTYTLVEVKNVTILSVIEENIRDEQMKAHSEEIWNKVFRNMKILLEKKKMPA